MTDTFNHGERRTFWERLGRLTGESTYRTPTEGRSTRSAHVPAAHQLAQALSYARQNPGDVGPDIAYDIVCQTTGYAVRVGRAVAAAMAADRNRAARRCRPWLRIIVWAAYLRVTKDEVHDQLRPAEVSEGDWLLLTEGAARILWVLAEEAVARAERAYWERGERRVA